MSAPAAAGPLDAAQMQAATAFANAIIASLRLPGGIHPATAIATAARMAGTYLFRSFGLQVDDVKPGDAVLSRQAAEQEGELVRTALTVLARLGMQVTPPEPETAAQKQNQPLLPFLRTQPHAERLLLPLREQHGLTDLQAAHVAAAATALLVRQFAKVLDPGIGFSVAAYGFIEGAKTAPAPMSAAPRADGGA